MYSKWPDNGEREILIDRRWRKHGFSTVLILTELEIFGSTQRTEREKTPRDEGAFFFAKRMLFFAAGWGDALEAKVEGEGGVLLVVVGDGAPDEAYAGTLCLAE